MTGPTPAEVAAVKFGWSVLQDAYRYSRAEPRELSIGFIAARDHLRKLQELTGVLPDPRSVVEIGREDLWEIVYGEPLAAPAPADPEED